MTPSKKASTNRHHATFNLSLAAVWLLTTVFSAINLGMAIALEQSTALPILVVILNVVLVVSYSALGISYLVQYVGEQRLD